MYWFSNGHPWSLHITLPSTDAFALAVSIAIHDKYALYLSWPPVLVSRILTFHFADYKCDRMCRDRFPCKPIVARLNSVVRV